MLNDRFYVERLIAVGHIASWSKGRISRIFIWSATMDNADLEKFRERIRNEADLFNAKSPFFWGKEDGQREALQWTFPFFLRYENAINIKMNVDNFTIEEIEELYSLWKSGQNARVIRVNRTDGGKGFEGVYEIIEERNDDLPEVLSDPERSEYLKGWIAGIHEVWAIAKKALSW
jgi:hypothetical protein